MSVKQFREMEDALREEYEKQYSDAKTGKDRYRVLGEMMKYRLIAEDDERIKKDNEGYAGIAKSHRFQYDYRTNRDFIGNWVCGRVRKNMTLRVQAVEHKVVEDGIEQVIPAREVQLSLRMVENRREVSRALKRLEYLQGTMDLQGLEKLVKRGVYRFYLLDIADQCIAAYKEVGAVVVRATEEGCESVVYLDYENLKNLHIPKGTGAREIKRQLGDLYRGKNKVKFGKGKE